MPLIQMDNVDKQIIHTFYMRIINISSLRKHNSGSCLAVVLYCIYFQNKPALGR